MNGSNEKHNDYDSGSYQFPALPVYRSGETTQESGIFTVVHPRQKESVEVVILRGTTLPYCPDCNHPLAFCLEQEAAYISEDKDFVPVKRNRKYRRHIRRKAAQEVRMAKYD